MLSTLTYHGLFQYPLTKEEILIYLIDRKSSAKGIDQALKNLKSEGKVGASRGYYFLNKSKRLPTQRIARTKISKQKFKNAKFYSYILKLIPTVKLVAITGALSMENSTKKDDIDLLVVTSKNMLWSTRFFANLLLLPWKRNPQSDIQKDKACLNLFLDESNLKISDKNLYTAHETCQAKLLWDRDNMYQKFVMSNKWVSKYLPNWQADLKSKTNFRRKTTNKSIFGPFLKEVEKHLKKFQLNYMSSRMTTEKIGDRQLFFHPKDTQSTILKNYQKALKTQRLQILDK